MVIAPSAYPLGGVADWLDSVLPGLQALGWRCVLGLVQGRFHDVNTYLSRHPWQDVRRIANPTGSQPGRIASITACLRQVRPDLVVVVNIAATYCAIRYLRLRGQPSPKVVMTLHGFQSDLLEDCRASVDVLDGVVSTNRLGVKMAASNMGSEERVFYAPCGVPVPSGRVAATTGVAVTQPLRLLYCGRFEQEQKRICDLVELASSLARRGVSCQISLAGAGPDEALLRQAIAARGAERVFRFLGVLAPTALSREYRRHDALIITSVWETGPIVAWEAMSHRLPVISSCFVGSGLEGALLNGRNCLLFPIGDMAAAADAVAALMAFGIRERLVTGGLELVQRRYSRSCSVSLWNDALHQILRLPSLPAPRLPSGALPQGRLDRWLGVKWGERVRRTLGVSYRHDDAGGEWPHACHGAQSQNEFLRWAREADGRDGQCGQ